MREIIAHLLGLDAELIETCRRLDEEKARRIEAEYEAKRLRAHNEHLRLENAWALKELKKREQ